MDVDAAALFERHAANPILTVGQLPYHANSVFNPGAARVGARHRPAGAGRGPAGDLAPGRRAERGRRDGLAVRRRAAARPATRGSPGGGLGLRGSAADLAPGTGGVGDRLHRLQPSRAARVAGDDPRLQGGPPARPGDAARGQGRRAVSAPVRRALGDGAPTDPASRRRAHVDLVLAGPPALGRPQPRARGARRCLVGRGQDRAGAAAARDARRLAALLPRGPPDLRGTDLPDRAGPARSRRPVASCCAGRTTGCSVPLASYERSGDVNKVVFPTGWVHDPETDLLSMYYGAGDSVIALATAKLRDLLDYLAEAPRPEHRRSTDHVGSW